MVFCFAAELLFARVDRRDQVLSELQTRVAEKPRWGVTMLEPAVGEFGGEPAILAEARFASSLDQDEIVARIEEFASGPRKPAAGSWYALHECPHDETLRPCAVGTRRVW